MDLVTPDQLARISRASAKGLPDFSILCFGIGGLMLLVAISRLIGVPPTPAPAALAPAVTAVPEVAAAALAPPTTDPVSMPAVESAAVPARAAESPAERVPELEWGRLPDGTWIQHQRGVSAMRSIGGG